MNREEFLKLSNNEVALFVQQHGPKVCIFFSNRTRRWFLSEQGGSQAPYFSSYIDASAKRLASIFRMFFELGITTLVLPVLSEDLNRRGEEYVHQIAKSLPQFLNHEILQSFYQENGVRVRFFGEQFEQFKSNVPPLRDFFDHVAQQTQDHQAYRIFYGMSAGRPIETVASLSVKFFQANGFVPDHKALTQMYFGEELPFAELFISSGKLYVADLPLLVDTRTQLYYCVAPSFFMTEAQLREILYDFMFSRRTGTKQYETLPLDEWRKMAQYFGENQNKTIGIGEQKDAWGLWYPIAHPISPPDEQA